MFIIVSSLRRKPVLSSLIVILLVILGALAAYTLKGRHAIATDPTRVEGYDIGIERTYSTWGELKSAAALVVIGTTDTQQAVDPRFPGDQVGPGTPWTGTHVTVERVLMSRTTPAP